MKVLFSLVREYTPEFNGNRELPEAEQCKATLKTLESLDLLELADAMERQGLEGTVDTGKMKAGDIKSLVSEVGRLLPKYVTVTNLEGSDGPISVEVLVAYPEFMELAIELLLQLSNISQPTEDDIKN